MKVETSLRSKLIQAALNVIVNVIVWGYVWFSGSGEGVKQVLLEYPIPKNWPILIVIMMAGFIVTQVVKRIAENGTFVPILIHKKWTLWQNMLLIIASFIPLLIVYKVFPMVGYPGAITFAGVLANTYESKRFGGAVDYIPLQVGVKKYKANLADVLTIGGIIVAVLMVIFFY